MILSTNIQKCGISGRHLLEILDRKKKVAQNHKSLGMDAK